LGALVGYVYLIRSPSHRRMSLIMLSVLILTISIHRYIDEIYFSHVYVVAMELIVPLALLFVEIFRRAKRKIFLPRIAACALVAMGFFEVLNSLSQSPLAFFKYQPSLRPEVRSDMEEFERLVVHIEDLHRMDTHKKLCLLNPTSQLHRSQFDMADVIFNRAV